jgi:hypothetical protein
MFATTASTTWARAVTTSARANKDSVATIVNSFFILLSNLFHQIQILESRALR